MKHEDNKRDLRSEFHVLTDIISSPPQLHHHHKRVDRKKKGVTPNTRYRVHPLKKEKEKEKCKVALLRPFPTMTNIKIHIR